MVNEEMAGNKCDDLDKLTNEHGFQNLVKGIQAQNISKISLYGVIERRWKMLIARLPESEQEHIDTFVHCLKVKEIRRLNMLSKDKQVGCGHANCETLLITLMKLSNVNIFGESIDDTTKMPVSKHEDISVIEQITSQSDKRLSYYDSCYDYYWELAKLFLDVSTQDDIALRGGLDSMSLIKLMKHCRLFEFENSDYIYDQILGDIQILVYAPNLKISNEQLIKVFQNLEMLLNHWKDSYVSCSDAITDIKQLDLSGVVDCKQIEYKLLVKNVLETVDSVLNLDKKEMDFSGSRTKFDEWSVSKTNISALLEQANGSLSASELDEISETEERTDNLKKESQTLKQQEDSDEERDVIITKFHEAIERLVNMEDEHTTLKSRPSSIEKTAEKLKVEARDTVTARDELQIKHDKLKIEQVTLNERIKTLSSDLDAANMTIARVTDELKVKKKEVVELQSERNELSGKNAVLEEQLDMLKREDANKENRKLKQTFIQYDKDTCIARLQLINAFGRILFGKLFYSERFQANKLQVRSSGSLQDFFILFDGVSILFDPLEDDLLKEFEPMRKVTRYVQEIDAVVLSTCMNSFTETKVKEIMQRYPGVKWLIPSERKNCLIDIGVDENSIIAFGIWEGKSVSFRHTEMTFACTPTSINSASSQGKMCNDCGWIIKGPERTFYFSGITNYNATHFKEIGKRYHPIHMALLPVADGLTNMSCLPEFTISTKEVVDMHVDLQSKQSLGIRNCYWSHMRDREEEIRKQMEDMHLEQSQLVFLYPGETHSSM